MRLDKYLKISRLIKRRTVANEACDAGKILVNDKVARASYDVKAGDVIEIQMGQKALKVRVEQVAEVVRKEDAAGLLRRLGEEAGGLSRRDIRNELGLPDALAGAAVGTQQRHFAQRQQLRHQPRHALHGHIGQQAGLRRAALQRKLALLCVRVHGCHKGCGSACHACLQVLSH